MEETIDPPWKQKLKAAQEASEPEWKKKLKAAQTSTPSFQQPLQPMTTPANGADGGALSGGPGGPSGASQQPPTGSVSLGAQGTSLAGTPPGEIDFQQRAEEAGAFRGMDVSGIQPPAPSLQAEDPGLPVPTNKKPREFAYGEGGFVQKPDGSTIDARDARIERDFAERQGVYSTLNLPGASQYSPAREKAMRDSGTWTDSDELRKKQSPLIIQSDLLRRKQEQLSRDIEKYNIPKLEEETTMLQGDLNYLGEELKKMQQSGNPDPAAFNDMVTQYNEKLDRYKKQASILRPFIEEQQDIQNGFEYLQSKHAQAEKEFAQSPTQKTKVARQEIADQRFATAEKDIRQGNYLTGNVLDQYVVSPVTATVTKGILGAAGALGRGLDAWVNIPNAVTGEDANYSPFAEAADNLFDAAEELAPTSKQASQPLFDKGWNMDTHALLPKAMQAATYMGMLGVAGAAGGEPGMVAASYMTTEEDYYKEGIGTGMKDGEAQLFSMTSAALTALLEKVNPGPLLNGKTVKGAMLERVTKALRDGKNWKDALKDGTQYVVKEGLGEGGQEMLQAGGDDLVKGSAKLAIGERADGLEMNTAQAYAENALLGLSMGTLAAIGGKATDRPLHMQSLDWAVRNRQKVEDYIKKSGHKDADILLERLDKISRVYAGNNLSAMPPEKSAKVASLVEQRNDAEKDVKEKPMDPVLKSVSGDPRERKVTVLSMEAMTAMGIEPKKAVLALAGQGMLDMPEGAKVKKSADGTVDIEVKPAKEGEKPLTKKAIIDDLLAQVEALTPEKVEPTAIEEPTVVEEPTAAPAESGVVDSPVSDEAAIEPTTDGKTDNAEAGATPAPIDAGAPQTEDTGAAPVLPVDEPTAAEPVLTQDQQEEIERADDNTLLGGQAEKDRTIGERTVAGQTYARNTETQGPTGKAGTVQFADGVDLPFTYAIVDAADLQPSHIGGRRNPKHFIPEAQPKSRTDKESQLASDRIGSAPDLGKVGASPNAYSGAPVVNSRGEVIQGNNRAEGLKKHYADSGTSYKRDLQDAAPDYGLNGEDIAAMKNPVLVRKLTVGDKDAIVLGNYDAKDVETGGKRGIDPVATSARIPSEAKAKITEALFAEGGDKTIKEAVRDNYGRVAKMLDPYLNPAQRNTLYNKGTNEPSAKGMQDLEGLVRHFLFDGGPTELADVFESGLPHQAQQGVAGAMPQLFSSPESIAIVREVQNGIMAAAGFRASDIESFDAWARQGDAFSPPPHEAYRPVELAIGKMLAEAKTAKGVREKLSQYAAATKPTEATMFDVATDGKTRQQAAEDVFGVKQKPHDDQGGDRKGGEKAPQGVEGSADAEAPAGKAQDKGGEVAKVPDRKQAAAQQTSIPEGSAESVQPLAEASNKELDASKKSLSSGVVQYTISESDLAASNPVVPEGTSSMVVEGVYNEFRTTDGRPPLLGDVRQAAYEAGIRQDRDGVRFVERAKADGSTVFAVLTGTADHVGRTGYLSFTVSIPKGEVFAKKEVLAALLEKKKEFDAAYSKYEKQIPDKARLIEYAAKSIGNTIPKATQQTSIDQAPDKEVVRVRLHGNVYDLVEERPDGTATLRNDQGDEFDTDASETYTKLASVEKPIASDKEVGTKKQFVQKELDGLRQRRKAAYDDAVRAAESLVPSDTKIPVGITKLTWLNSRPRLSKEQRAALTKVRVAEDNLNADTRSDAENYGRVYDKLQAPAQAEAPPPKKQKDDQATEQAAPPVPDDAPQDAEQGAPIGKSEAAARRASAILEKAKLKKDRLYALPIPPSVWNGAIGALQEVIVAGGKAADAIAAAIKHIQASDWWKNKATQKEKDEVIGHLQGRISDLEAAIAHEDVASLKDNIKKARSAAVKGERGKQQEARKEFVKTVCESLKELANRLSPAQVRAITASAARTNPASDRSVAAFMRHAERIIDNAQYAADVEKAKDYRKKAKKMSKRENVPLNHKEVLASMARMDVGALPDPAAFNAIAEQYMQQFAPMTQGYVPQSSADALDALAKMHESAAEERFKEHTEDADDALAGAMAAESADEFADGIEEDAKEKLRNEMVDMAEDAKFSITEQFDEEDLSGKERGILKKLREADIEAMSLDQMREYIKTVDNIGINGSFDGAAKVAAMVEGVASVSKAKEAVATTPLRRAWTGNVGSFFQQQFSSTSGLFRFLFGMGEGMAKFHNALGATDLELSKKKYDDSVRDIKEKMADFYTAHRKKYKNSDSAETIVTEAMIAFAVQPVRGYDAEQSFEIQKRIIEENIERLREKEKTAKEAELWQGAYDSMLKDAKTREDLLAKAKKTSPAAYESVMFLKDKVLAPYTDLLRAHKEQFWGEDFGENDMYLPITYRFFGKQEDLEPSKQGVFASNRVDKPKEAANLIGRKGVTTLPAGMVISPNLRRNVLTSSSRNLYDAHTSDVWQRINQFFKTPGAASVVGGVDNLDYLNFGLKTLQSAQRREGGGAQDKMDRAVGKLIQRARRYASHLALGGIRQFLQQPADQLTNAMVNVGPQLVGRSITQVNKARPLLALSSIGDRGELIGGTNWDNTLEAEMASLARALQGGLVDRFDAATEEIQRAIMFALTKSDTVSARTAWIAYYTKYIEENGGELMDWQKEADAIKDGDEFRREALAYATVNTDVTQGSSDPTKMARIAQHGGNSWQSLAKGVFNPFSAFTIGMRERITNDIADITYGGNMYDENGDPTPHGERAQQAARSLTATIAANTAFTAIRVYVVKAAITAGAAGLRALMRSAFGDDDDEKDDAENRLAIVALIFNLAHTMKMMDADIYRTVAEAYKQEKRENSSAPSNTEEEEAIKKAKLAYTSLLQSMMVSGYTPFIEAGSVDAINRMGYYIQLLGSDPAMTSSGAPMKYEYWVKQPENPPLYRTGQGYDSGDYGVMSVISDKIGAFGDQAQELLDTANDTPERKEARKQKEQKKERMTSMDTIADQVASGAMTWDEAMKSGREQLEKDGVHRQKKDDPQGSYVDHLKNRMRYDRAPEWVKEVLDADDLQGRVDLVRKKLSTLSGHEHDKQKWELIRANVWTNDFDKAWARTK